jgi:cobalt-zinc-cadmium efflux system protein
VTIPQQSTCIRTTQPSPRHPHGYPNATNIAALVNGGWLLVLSVLIAVSAVRRLIAGVPSVEGLPVLIVSGAAAVVMAAGALILGGQDDDDDGTEDLNVRAVLLDTAADAASAGGVAVSGAIIILTSGTYWLDPAVACVIAVIVGYHAARLIKKVIAALRPSRRPDPEPGGDI